MAKLRIAGAWAGVLEGVELENWTVPMLREEVAKRSNTSPNTINLICSGKVLRDGDGKSTLLELGIKDNSKVMANKVASVVVSDETGKSVKDEFLAEEQRCLRLTRLKAAAAALAQRHSDGSLLSNDYNLELEDQRGQQVKMTETDQKAIMMGLMFHSKGKRLLEVEEYKDALEVLEMGEEAFSLCESHLIQCVDNVPMLQLDMVWCYFMLRDINLLSLAGERLSKARKGIERAHGKDGSRLRKLNNGSSAEHGLYLRLELLEGVAAFHSGNLEKSRVALSSAKARYSKLQISDEALSQLLSMGYKEHEAKRALKFNEQDVGGAVNFIMEERDLKAKRVADNIKREQELREQRRYGKTPLGKAVDLPILNGLVSIGYEKELAAEALRRHENDFQKALDDLTNPQFNANIQLDIETKKRKRQDKLVEARTAALAAMGFDRSRVAAVVNQHGVGPEALNALLAEQDRAAAAAAEEEELNAEQDPAAAGIAGEEAMNTEQDPAAAGMAEEESMNTEQDPAAAGVAGAEALSAPQDLLAALDEEVSLSPSTSGESDRDYEMEEELTSEVGHRDGDASADYDLDVTKEGEAIDEYLALLDSALEGRK